MLSKNKHDNKYMSVGIITSKIAEAVKNLSGKRGSELLLVMSERNFTHANSPKHIQKGIALTQEEYAKLPMIIAEPHLLLFDKSDKHHNLIYINREENIKVIVDLPIKQQKLKPQKDVDVLINTYKIKDYSDILGKIKKGDYVVIEGTP
ncbi:Uncharacterised protein [Canicola haemoglobinophilus]|uniref:Uncharacterized protein n=4 Tax=Canicola haemoglobinophilus TaxID=733 RepID=A0A377HSI5_9PAST|nr:hypothetical protein [Canicola haemoglobinophilus]STO59293.1 Uncharacterised protein [Canicola haemoglobinophilus]